MAFPDDLDAIETIADNGDIAAAVEAATALLASCSGVEAAQAGLMVGGLQARLGQLSEALEQVSAAQALAEAAGATALVLEARVTRASIHAALGEYDDAMEGMRSAIRDMDGVADVEVLRRDAAAELRGYVNLVSPKNKATWASLLKR